MCVGADPDISGNLTVAEGCSNCEEECVQLADKHIDYGGYFSPLGAPQGSCELPYPPTVPEQVAPGPGMHPLVIECECD